MNVKENIFKRRAVRSYMDTSIPKNVMTDILDSANRTPSWSNSQPWEVYVVSGDKLNALRSIWEKEMVHMRSIETMTYDRMDIEFPGYDAWQEAPRAIENMMSFKAKMMNDIGEDAPLSDSARAEELFHKLKVFFDAPTVVFLGMNNTLGPYSIYDVGAYGQTLMLAAREHDVMSCPAAAFVFFGDILREYLDIPENVAMVMGIAMGYEDKEHILNRGDGLMTRMELNQYVHMYE